MDGSDAMAFSIVVGIPDLMYIYMELEETASSNLHASGVTYSPRKVARSAPSQTLLNFQEAHLSSVPTGHGWE